MALNLMPLVNGKSYEWSSVKVLISNLFIIGITDVTYEQKQNKQNNYGAGDQPVSYGNGSKEATCTLTIKFEELQNIREASLPSGQIVDLPPFDIIVSYLDTSLTPVTHKIRNCRFTNDPLTTKQGDTSIDCALNILPSHIEYV